MQFQAEPAVELAAFFDALKSCDQALLRAISPAAKPARRSESQRHASTEALEVKLVEIFHRHPKPIEPKPAAEVIAARARGAENQQALRSWKTLWRFDVKPRTDHFQFRQFNALIDGIAQGLSPGSKDGVQW